jgi:carbamoyl-phosphate synthase large subunit
MNILVTGAGGPAGVCTIKALKGKHRVIAVDMDSYASGLYMADKGYKVPAANDIKYLPKILEICRKENVTFVFPTVGEELLAFSGAIEQFKSEGITVAVSGYTSILIANNKLSTYDFFKGKRYCPALYDKKTTEFPCVVKPVNSRGGRGFNVCTSNASLDVALDRNKVYGPSVIMEYLKGNEYSVYGLSDLTAKPILSLANRRIMAKGESKVAELAPNAVACKVAESIANGVGLVGPWNVQLIDVNGCYKIVEINPRIAGSASLIMASGIDYTGLIIKVFTNQEITTEELECKNRVYMIRYNEEIFLKPESMLH